MKDRDALEAGDQVDTDLLDLFLAEDVGSGDLTAAVVPAQATATATVITREPMVLCGRAWFEGVFRRLDRRIAVDWNAGEGQFVTADELLCTLTGPARALLTGERTALNLLQTLSGTASLARRYAEAVAGTGVKVLDTRKTVPGLRRLQKYAVLCGGCHNHRIGLFDGVLIKENHIVAAGSIAAAVGAARTVAQAILIEVEVETLAELSEAIAAEAERALLDNFSVPMMREAVALAAGRIELEVSGNVTLKTIREMAETGVNYISVGALTKHVHAIDLSMRIIVASAQ